MPAVSTYSPTSDPYLNGLLGGTKWAVNSLTFSFPTDPSYYGSYGSEPTNGFQAFTATQQNAIRTILNQYSAVANLNFTEVAETATQHGDLRYAESNAPSTAWAYYPTTSAVGGDAWFNSSSGYYNNPVLGNYAWLTMMHETGHAMGLKHPHEAMGSFGAMPLDRDSLEYTVMSYRSYTGGPAGAYTPGTWSFPQTLMMYDIAALQKLYGANFATNGGDTSYRWDATTGRTSINGVAQAAPGGNKVFLTIWDGGGQDTYDLSNYTTSLNINLEPGMWTTLSATQLANLGSGKLAAGNIANALLYNGNVASLIEAVIGGMGNDTIIGNAADNTLKGGGGNDVLDGHGGNNSAVYSGALSDYSRIENTNGSWTITDLRTGSLDGIDTLLNIQTLKFSDTVLTIGTPVTPPPPPPPTNQAPTALGDAYTGKVNTAIQIAAGGVLGNDTDPDGNALSSRLVSGPSHGTLALQSNGSFVYTPFSNYTGTDSFSYRANDGSLDSNLATVNLTVKAATKGGGGRGGKGQGADVDGTDNHARGHGGQHDAGMENDQIPSWQPSDDFSFGHLGRGETRHDVSGHGGSIDDAHGWHDRPEDHSGHNSSAGYSHDLVDGGHWDNLL